MCAQCMATAATVAAGATGVRAWLAASAFSWLTARRLRLVTAAIVVGGVVVVALL